MFAINASKRLTSVTTTIIQNVELSALLNGTYQNTEIPICPTQAISVVDNAIDNDRCIACGICRKLIPDAIKYSPEKGDVLKFIDYCNVHKMFVYKWLCLSSYYLSGIEIFIKGFSRNKRIPFVGLVEKRVRFTKCAYSVRELEKSKAELNDMVSLASNVINTSLLERSIVLIQEPSNQRERDYLNKLSGYTLFELIELYNRFMSKLL
jgi:Pyruvate/2-oxoacid:ferredoxin oxidoreductase delta subunit